MTVKELITQLKTLNQDLPVVINDADTEWLLNLKCANLYYSPSKKISYVSLFASYDSFLGRDVTETPLSFGE